MFRCAFPPASFCITCRLSFIQLSVFPEHFVGQLELGYHAVLGVQRPHWRRALCWHSRFSLLTQEGRSLYITDSEALVPWVLASYYFLFSDSNHLEIALMSTLLQGEWTIQNARGGLSVFMFMWLERFPLSFRNRAEFLCHMKPSERNPSSSGPVSGTWTLVDEGGEEVTRHICSILMNYFCALSCANYHFKRLFCISPFNSPNSPTR